MRIALFALASLVLLSDCGPKGDLAQEDAPLPAASHSAIETSEDLAGSDRSSPTRYASNEAMLILEKNYQASTGWHRLDGVSSNGDEMARALTEQGFTVDPESDLDGRQMRDAIEEFLTRPRKKSDLSRVVLYFAGHGTTVENGSARQGYLVPVDAPAPLNDQDRAELAKRAISVDWLRAVALASTARHTILILDSCFSSSILGLTRGSIEPAGFSELDDLERRSVFVLTASDRQTPDVGPFTPAVVAGIRGAADSEVAGVRDGLVTADELNLFVWGTVTQWSRQHPERAVGVPHGVRIAGYGQVMFGPPSSTSLPGRAPGPLETLQQNKLALFSRPLRENEHPILGGCGSTETKEDQTERLRTIRNGRVPILVCYYVRSEDGTRVTDALNSAGIPYVQPPAILTNPTNYVACGADVPLETARFVALTLFDNGVRLQRIGPIFRARASERRNQIQVLANTEVLDRKPLTRSQIEHMTSCQTDLMN